MYCHICGTNNRIEECKHYFQSGHEVKNQLTFKLVAEEARELSWKLQNTVYVIQKGNTLFTSLNYDNGKTLCAYKLGNEIKQ